MKNEVKGRECICCGKIYQYCGHCIKDKHKPTYMALYCSDNCHSIFTAANDFNFELITKEEAQKKLNACDLSSLDNFNDIVKADVKKILAKPETQKAEQKVEQQATAKKPFGHE